MRSIRTDMQITDRVYSTLAFGDCRAAVEHTLSRLRLLDPNAIIAGGACRDAVLGNPIADIDAYFYVPTSSDVLQTIDRLRLAGFTDVREMRPDGSSNGHYAGMEQLRWVFETTVGGYPVQLIAMAVPTFSDCVDSFGVNISKCWYSGNNISVSQEAHEDMVNSKLTVPVGTTTSQRYVDKLVRKLQPSNGVHILGAVLASGVLVGGDQTAGFAVGSQVYYTTDNTPVARTERVTEDDEMFERLTQGL